MYAQEWSYYYTAWGLGCWHGAEPHPAVALQGGEASQVGLGGARESPREGCSVGSLGEWCQCGKGCICVKEEFLTEAVPAARSLSRMDPAF